MALLLRRRLGRRARARRGGLRRRADASDGDGRERVGDDRDEERQRRAEEREYRGAERRADHGSRSTRSWSG